MKSQENRLSRGLQGENLGRSESLIGLIGWLANLQFVTYKLLAIVCSESQLVIHQLRRTTRYSLSTTQSNRAVFGTKKLLLKTVASGQICHADESKCSVFQAYLLHTMESIDRKTAKFRLNFNKSHPFQSRRVTERVLENFAASRCGNPQKDVVETFSIPLDKSLFTLFFAITT